jgi:hypothetical protein
MGRSFVMGWRLRERLSAARRGVHSNGYCVRENHFVVVVRHSLNQLVISRRASAGSGELPELLYSFVRMLAAVAEPTETERLVIANSRKRRKTAAKRLWLTPSGCSKDEPATAE